MKHHFLLGVIICFLIMNLSTPFLVGQAQQPEVSLDDNPSTPFMGPVIPPFMSAEDEFGFGLIAAWAGMIGPSPTLGMGFFDSDVLFPGPGLLIRFAPAPIMPPLMPPNSSPYYMDAISCDHSPMVPCPGGLFVRFSVDRATGGITPADASYQQALNNEQPADIFRTIQPFNHVGNFVPLAPPIFPPYGGPLTTAGTGGSNQLMYDHFGTFGFFPPPPCPPITPGSHDNIDAFNEWPNSLRNSNIYFCLHPAEAIFRNASPADIFVTLNPPGGLVWPTAVFAPAMSMGLDTFGFATDSVDGLALWDNGIPGVLEPGIDYAAFSLAPGSVTLSAVGGLTAGDVFLTDFQGFFYTWLFASDMGVGNFPNPPLPVIKPSEINVDALDLTIDPDPVPYINPVTKPVIDPGTKE